MGRKATAGTRQLAVEIGEALRDRIDARVEAEQRTLRAVVERAIIFYMDNVPLDAAPSFPAQAKAAAAEPKKGKAK